MKKALLLFLLLSLTACATPAEEQLPVPDAVETLAPAPQETEAFTLGIGLSAHVSKSMHATFDFPGYARTEVTVAAVVVDGEGVIRACTIDGISTVISFDNTGTLLPSNGTLFPSKASLGRDYGMHKASALGTEWYQQAADYAAACVGKRWSQLQKGDTVTSVTISTDTLRQAVRSAATDAHTAVPSAETPALFCRAVIDGSHSASASDDLPGLARLRVAAMCCVGDTTVTCAMISAVPFTASGRIVCDISQSLSTLSDVLMPAEIAQEDLPALRQLAAAVP